MSEVSAVLGTTGAQHQLTHAGKTYSISLINQKVKAAFEKRFFEVHKASLAELRDIYPADAYLAEIKELTNKYRRGEFALLSQAGLSHIQTFPGALLLLSLLLDCEETEAMTLVSTRFEDIQRILTEVLHESFPGLEKAKEAKPDPPMPPG